MRAAAGKFKHFIQTVLQSSDIFQLVRIVDRQSKTARRKTVMMVNTVFTALSNTAK